MQIQGSSNKENNRQKRKFQTLQNYYNDNKKEQIFKERSHIPYVQFQFNVPHKLQLANKTQSNLSHSKKCLKKQGVRNLQFKTQSQTKLSIKHVNHVYQSFNQPFLVTEIPQKPRQCKINNFFSKQKPNKQTQKPKIDNISKTIIRQSKFDEQIGYNKTSEDVFKEVNKRMIFQSQINKRKVNKKDCFYLKLKDKLMRELHYSDEQSKRQQIMFMIEGCQKQKHTIRSATQFKLNNRNRPNSALNINNYRPYEANRSRKTSGNLSLQKLSLGINYTKPNQSNSTRNKEQKSRPNTCRNSLVNSPNAYHSLNSSFYATQKQSKDLNNLNSNKIIEEILKKCQQQKTDPGNINKSMKIFEFYCKRIDNELQKTAFALQQIKDKSFQLQ